ncbi:unnamed protein product [Prorocentrum cordatum]|uniref:Nucleolar protein 6 n=1 Tax=Prorocentrum cordatum TaxID=2364126 RepID=A0ABN9RRY2_9DINO|nr:unnamed protein product [Polarella glacialis]
MAAGKKRQKAGGDGGGLGGDEPAAKKAAAPAAEDTAPADAAPRQQAEAPAAKPESAFRAPDAAEVMEIARTRNLYKSNLFRLQLEELLKELAPRRAARARLEAFLHGLRPVLLGLEARELPADLAAEFPQLLFQQRQPFPMTFAAPKRIDVVGSFLLGTCLRSSLQADVALEMPAETFQSKDYLNFRYWDKRAAYVGEVRRQLAKAQGRGAPLAGVELLFEALHGDPCRPCLTLRPLDQDATAPWAVRLLPSCAADLFPPPKLAPNRNSVRPAEGAAAAAPAPTAQYNSCILEDVRMRACLEYLHRALQRFPSLRDAVLLLKRWAWARGFLAQQPGAQRAGGGLAVFMPLSGFCLSVLAAHAAQTASVAPTETSSFQLFKLALSVLASIDWESQKLVLGAAAPRALTAEERSTRGANFFDADGILNFFWRLGPFIGELKREAQRALTLLDTEADPYDAVFGRRMAPELLWDCVVRAPLLGSAAATPALAAPPPPHTVLGTPPPADACEALSLAARLPEVLAAGLGDRCLQVSARLVGEPGPRWDRERPAGALAVVAGITLDALHLDRSLDRGPSAEDVEAAARFRSLWGPEKSELRRFKDGSILECAVWTKPPADRAADSKKHPAVVTQILLAPAGQTLRRDCVAR